MDSTIDSILVPTDGSDGAKAGVRRGIELAATLQAEFHVLSVVDTRSIETVQLHDDSGELTDRGQLLVDEAERRVEEAAGLASEHLSSQIETAVERGIPYWVINDYVQENDVDLVVMGTEGRTGLQQQLLGSVTEKTLRTSRVPIVVVPPDAPGVDIRDLPYEDILVPTDGSEGAERAVDVALSLASAYDGTIHALYSADTSRLPVTETGELYDELETTGREALERVRDFARASNVSVTGELGSGPAARLILSYSDEQEVDLIVMGTHGRSGLKRYLLGSVTEEVVREASVPVCCVPMKNQDAA